MGTPGSPLQTLDIGESDLDFSMYGKLRSLSDHSSVILLSFKMVVIFNITSADFVLMSADVVLKMTTILKEMRIIAQLCSKSERTLGCFSIFVAKIKTNNLKQLRSTQKNQVQILFYFVSLKDN